MAFATLFTSLSTVSEDVTRPRQPGNRCETGEFGRKRKARREPSGPVDKKHFYPTQTTRTYIGSQHNTDHQHSSDGSTWDGMDKHSGGDGYNSFSGKSRNHKPQKKPFPNTQQQQKQPKNKRKCEGQWRTQNKQERGRPGCRGARAASWKGVGGRENVKNAQNFEEERKRPMTQEFIDRNALMVNGRLVCRYFLWGRCTKGDDCQLEHMCGYNDLLKEVCKFYVQGFCSRGESCPYMHKTFPCKFFHKGKCSQGADCKFSHEPLNELTNQLLEEALKRDHDIAELRKKQDQESSGQPEITDECEILDTNKIPDVLLQPVRPNFYNSTETNVETEGESHKAEQLAENMDAVPSQESDAIQPHTSPTTSVNPEEPVCYSVEAMLGPQLSKPFFSFYSTPGSQDSSLLSSPDADKAPYSVSNVLSSFKSVENSFGCTSTCPPAQTVSYTPKSDLKEGTDSPISSGTQNEKIFSLVDGRTKEEMFKSPPPLSVTTQVSHEVKLELSSPAVASCKGSRDIEERTSLPMDITSSLSKPTSHTSASKHPAKLSVLTSHSQGSLGSTESERRPSISSAPAPTSSTSRETANSHIPLGSKNARSAECGGKTTISDSLGNECEKTLKRPFKSLVASPITETPQPVDLSKTSSSVPQENGSARPHPQSVDYTSTALQDIVRPDKTPTRSFLSLFAAPLSAAPLPCIQSKSDNTRTTPPLQQMSCSIEKPLHLSESKQRAVSLETPLTHQIRTNSNGEKLCLASGSLKVSPKPRKGKKEKSPEHQHQPCLVSTRPTPCSNSPSRESSHHQPPHISPHKGSAAEDSASSVFRTLFLSLSPYQQDSDAQVSLTEDQSSKAHVFVKQKRKKKRKSRRKNELMIQDSQKLSPGETAESTTIRSAVTESQVRNSCTFNNKNVVTTDMKATPLKDLFKSLDAIGH